MRQTIKVIFGVLFLCSSLAATSQAATQKHTLTYKDQWHFTQIKSPEATIDLYVRNSSLSTVKNTANITVSRKNKVPLQKVVDFLKTSVGTPTWTSDKIDGLDIYESVDSKAGYLFRIATNAKTNEYSFGAVKLRFLMPSYVELHLYQVETLTGKPSKKTAEMLWDLLAPKVYAADYRATAQSYANNVQNYVVETTHQATAPLTGSINHGATAIEGLNTTAQNALPVVEKASGEVSGSINKFNSTVKDTVSTKNVVKLAAAGAMAGTLMSLITTAAVTGAWNIAKAGYYQIVGEFSPDEKRRRIEGFEEALKTFNELAPSVTALDAKLSRLENAFAPLTKRTAEEMLAQLRLELRELENMEAADGKCIKCFNVDREVKITELKKNIADIEAGIQPNKAVTCRELGNLSTEWETSERLLGLAKQAIIRDARTYIDFLNQIPDVEGYQENRMQNNACLSGVEKKLRRIASDVAEQGCERNPNSVHSVCRDYRSYLRVKKSCERLDGTAVGPGLKSDIIESSSIMSEKVAELSETLGSLDCEQASGNACVKPGAFTQIQMEMRARMAKIQANCPTSGFVSRVSTVVERASLPPSPGNPRTAVAQLAPQKSESKPGFFKSLWSRIWPFGKSSTPAEPTDTGARYKLSNDSNYKLNKNEQDLYAY